MGLYVEFIGHNFFYSFLFLLGRLCFATVAFPGYLNLEISPAYSFLLLTVFKAVFLLQFYFCWFCF